MSRKDLNKAIQSKLEAFATNAFLFQQHVAEQMRLHPTDFHCIHILTQNGALGAGQLAEYLHLTTGATTAVIDRLCALGFARRVPAAQDRRRVMVELHPEGIKKIRQLYRPVDSSVQQSLQQFSDSELETIHRFLTAMTALEPK